GTGAAGIAASGSLGFVQEVLVQGGEGGWTCNSNPGRGGVGVSLTNSTVVWSIATTPEGGLGGCLPGFICGTGCNQDGQALVLSGGAQWQTLPLPVRRLRLEHTLSTPGDVTLQFRGEVGDRAHVAQSSGSRFDVFPSGGGVKHLLAGFPGNFHVE